jgi:hypothetical protein
MNLKAKSKNFFIKLALIILLGTFAFGGLSNLFFGGDDYIVKIGKEKFTPHEFNEFRSYEIKAIEEQLGKEALSSLNKAAINNIILSKFIDQKLITKLADGLNISINDQLLKWWIINSGFFADKGEKFNKERYFELLKSRKLSEKDFLNSIKEYLKRKTIVDVVSSLDFENKLLKQEEETHRNLEANFDILQIKANQDFVVSPEEVNEFYKQKKQQFLTPETRNITYITLSTDDLIKNIEVTDSEALAEYNNNLDKSFKLFEFSNELEAKKYLSSSKLAENLNDKITVSELKNEDLNATQAKIAATLSKENNFSRVFPQDGKYYILQAEYKGKNIPTFAEVKKEIKDNIIRTQARVFLSNKENELRSSDLLQNMSLEEIAQNYGWKIAKITDICASCAKTNEQYQKLAGKFTSMPEVVFDSVVGQNSALEESQDYDGSLVVRVDNIKEAGFLAIEEVTPQINAELKQQKLHDFLVAKSNEFKTSFEAKQHNLNDIKKWLDVNQISISSEKNLSSHRFLYVESQKEKNDLSEGALNAVFVTKPNFSNWYYDNESGAHMIIVMNKFYESKIAKTETKDKPRTDIGYEELMIYLSKYYDVKVADSLHQEN